MKRLIQLLLIELIFLVCAYLTFGAIYWAYRGHNNLLTALMALFLILELWLIILFGCSIRNAMKRPTQSEKAEDEN
jgi:hypothetical protein